MVPHPAQTCVWIWSQERQGKDMGGDHLHELVTMVPLKWEPTDPCPFPISLHLLWAPLQRENLSWAAWYMIIFQSIGFSSLERPWCPRCYELWLQPLTPDSPPSSSSMVGFPLLCKTPKKINMWEQWSIWAYSFRTSEPLSAGCIAYGPVASKTIIAKNSRQSKTAHLKVVKELRNRRDQGLRIPFKGMSHPIDPTISQEWGCLLIQLFPNHCVLRVLS